MLRYISLVWNDDQADARESARGLKQRLVSSYLSWTISIDEPGLLVCVDDNPREGSAILLPGGLGGFGGVVGTIFRNSNSVYDSSVHRTKQFSLQESKSLIESAGRSLIDSHWGSYVLFVHTQSNKTTHVLRSPAGDLPCFWTHAKGVTIFYSLVDDFLALDLLQVSINWDCIRAQAAGGDYLTRETGIKEISTAICGECIEVSGNVRSVVSYWNPASLRSREPIEKLEDAARLLREKTQFCIDARASLHESILLELSGGLDSSIVLACLQRATTKPRVISVNFFSTGAGDERRFARSMTQKYGTELIEIESNKNVDLRTFLNCARTASPVLSFSAYDIEPVLVELAHQRNATAVFTGEIGDDIFGHAIAPESLAECLQSYGLRPKSLAAAINYAELKRVSLWKALRQAISYKRWLRRTGYWSSYQYWHWLGQTNEKQFVSKEVARDYETMLPRFIHPWFRDVQDMPFGRMMLLYGIVTATSTWSHSPFASTQRVPFMSPIVSQPLIEALTRIPSHLHFKDAENGAVAREAFRSELSEIVVNRGTGKGTPSPWVRDLIDRNRSFLRELFFDGILVREKILDKSKLEAMLSERLSKAQVGIAEFVRQIYIESWLRRWSETNTTKSSIRA